MDASSYWEAIVHTTPSTLGTVDPGDPAGYVRADARATSVDLILATESGVAVREFRSGGHDHEKAVVLSVAQLLQQLFPKATVITVEVLYGESHLHSKSTYTSGQLDYSVVDSL